LPPSPPRRGDGGTTTTIPPSCPTAVAGRGSHLLAVERDPRFPEPVPRIALDGWERFAARAPRAVREGVGELLREHGPLVDALRATPSTLLHGDWKLSNLGTAPDGRTVLLDWAYPGKGPVAHELSWYLSLNHARLPRSRSTSPSTSALVRSGGRARTSNMQLQRLPFCQLNYPREALHASGPVWSARWAFVSVNGGSAWRPCRGVQDAGVARHRQAPRPQPLDRLRDAYDRTHPRLWRALRAWSGSGDVADEAAAEAFAQAARRIDALRDVDAWVWRAGFRIAAGELHRRGRRPVPSGDAIEQLRERAELRSVDADSDLPAIAIDLVRSLRQLTEQQRACVVLRDVAGLSAAEIAAVLQTTAGTVRVQLFRSRRALRHLLEADDD
jgi:RNA polymerase sigma factor (sigma-70 family)